MDDNQTNWTPFSDDNLLGLIDKNQINEFEATGIAKSELYIFELETDIELSTTLILEIHKIAFSELYDWAGKWRKTEVSVGQLLPPKPNMILHAMYQFIDNLNFKIAISKNREEHIDCLVYAHYEFIKIHPFNNGNGRTGRILMNVVALKFGYKPLELYYRQGESRQFYIGAMKEADNGNFKILSQLIGEELISF
jgi:cell filamentation protein